MAERRSNDEENTRNNLNRGDSNNSRGRRTSNDEELRKDWHELNERLERIIRKLARDEQENGEEQVRLEPEDQAKFRPERYETDRDDDQGTFFGDERDNTIRRLEEEKEHLKQLRDKLERLQQDQKKEQREEQRRGYEEQDDYDYLQRDRPQREEYSERDYTRAEERTEMEETEDQEISYGEFGEDEPSFVERRSKTEMFLLGVLTGMVLLFLINLLMSPPIVAA